MIVSWDAQPDVASYTVWYNKTMGPSQLGNCKSTTHMASVSTTDNSTSIAVRGSEDSMLRAFTTYSFTVTVVSATSFLGSSGPSSAVVATTAQTGMYWYAVYIVGYCVCTVIYIHMLLCSMWLKSVIPQSSVCT